MKPSELRERLNLSRAEWARALNINIATVKRWEDDDADPGGLAAEVMRAVNNALAEGADAARIGRLLSLGIGSLLYYSLVDPKILLDPKA